MKPNRFSDPEVFLLNNWASAMLLERSMKAVRDKYAAILDAALDKVAQRHKELDCRAIHLSDNWEFTAGIGRKSWPSMHPRWPSGFWLGCNGLDNLTSMEADAPYACVWCNLRKASDIASVDIESDKSCASSTREWTDGLSTSAWRMGRSSLSRRSAV
jgi:hypothetical protein